MKLQTSKDCARCHANKPMDEFGWRSKARRVYQSYCNACRVGIRKEWRAKNPDKSLAQSRRAFANRQSKGLKQFKKYDRNYYLAHKEQFREQGRLFWRRHSEELKTKKRTYNKTRRDQARLYWQTNRRGNIQVRLAASMRARVIAAVRGITKADKTFLLVGCSVYELLKHIESQFTEGMNWGNYGLHGWHIDHKRPCASFDLSDSAQQRECFHFSNLQPLWAADNWSKGSRV